MLLIISQNFNHNYTTALEIDGRNFKSFLLHKNELIELAKNHLRKENSYKKSISYAKGEYILYAPYKCGRGYDVNRVTFYFEN